MTLTESDKLRILLPNGPRNIIFKDMCAVYALTLDEIAAIGYDIFQEYLSLLCVTRPMGLEDKNLQKFINGITDFEFFLLMCLDSVEHLNKVKNAFYVLTKEDIHIIQDKKEIVIGPIIEQHILNEESFYDFQDLIKSMYLLQEEGNDDLKILPTDSERMKEYKRKLAISRRQVTAAKAKKGDDGSNIAFSDLVASVASQCPGYTLESIGKLTYYAFFDQFNRMKWIEEYDMNMRMAAAGAKIPKEQLKYWIRPISSKN